MSDLYLQDDAMGDEDTGDAKEDKEGTETGDTEE